MANKGPFPDPTVAPPHRRPAQFPVTGRGEGDSTPPPAGSSGRPNPFAGRSAAPQGPPPESPVKRKAKAKNLAMLQAIVGKLPKKASKK